MGGRVLAVVRTAPRITQAIKIKSLRRHVHCSCGPASAQPASRRFPLEPRLTHRDGLASVDRAIQAVGGEAEQDVIDLSLRPGAE